jgi:Protein of unknown function (DUF3047)
LTTTGLLTTLAVSTATLAVEPSAFSSAVGGEPPAPWHFAGLPESYGKPATQFDIADIDGKKALRVRADKAYGNLVHPWNRHVSTVKWRWRLDTPLRKANLSAKSTEDIALKLCFSFDVPIEQIPSDERSKFKLAQFFSREKLPTATLCYIWAYAEAVGAQLPSPFTNRVRYIVVDSGEKQLKTWHEHSRNVDEDFHKLFGAETPQTPHINTITVGADSDNTHGLSLGYVADITVQP